MLIANVREKNQPSTSQLTINWGRGRLSNHESFFGFAAKFCRLNRLTPRQFREFWNSLFVVSDYRRKENTISRIAQILDEPLSVVKTVFKYSELDNTWPPANLKEFKIKRDQITYCPECLIEGYHGNFHESNWLKKCPIHRIDLICELIPYSSRAKVDRRLIKLLSLLDLNCPEWELSEGKYRLKTHIKQNKYFYKFLYWRSFAEKSVFKHYNIWLGRFGCNSFTNYPFYLNENDRLIIMNKIGLIKPIPEEFYELFNDSDLSEELEIQNFHHKLGDELKIILIFFKYDDLLSLFKLVQIVKGEVLSFQKILEAKINDLNLQHPFQTCSCVWGINKHGQLVNSLPGELKYFSDFMCPYEFAANELYEKWLNLLPDINFLPYVDLDNYTVLAHKAKHTKIASVVGYSLGEQIPILKFNWSEQITDLFDIILEKVVLAHIDELKNWLSSIERGNPPNLRERFPPNIYLVQNPNSGLQLISWQAGRNIQAQ